MKKIIYSAVLLLIFNTCKAQNTKKMENTFEIPEITKEFEKFDIKKFNNNVNPISGKLIISNEDFLLEKETQNPGYIIKKYFKNSPFMISKKIFNNGNIEQKAISFVNGYPIGPIFQFDKEGKLIAEIDTDIGYDYGWDDILAYCRENDIPLTKGYPERGGIKTEIHKDEEGGKKVWTLRYNNNKTFQYLEVTLDGKTGAVLNQRKLEFH